MASTDSSIPNSRPVSSWKISLSLLGCIMSACATLNVLVRGLEFWFLAFLCCVIVLGVAALVRVWVPVRVVPPLAASIALFLILTQQFAVNSTIIGLIPTWSTFSDFAQLAQDGQVSIAEQSVPAVTTNGILFLICAGVGLIALACDTVAITFGTRALVGVPILIVLWIPVLTSERDFDLFWVIATAVAYLYLLRAGSLVPHRRLSLVIGSGALVVALVAQVVLPSVDPVVAGQATSIGTGVSPIVNLGDDLRRDAERRVLTYTTESGHSQYLKLVSLEEFDGDNWLEGDVAVDRDNDPQSFAQPVGLSSSIERTSETSWVDVGALDTKWLPLPYPTTSVTGLERGWSWDASSLSLRSRLRVATGEEFRATSLVLDPTPEQLSVVGSTVPAALAHLAVIDQEVPPIISETAATVVGDAPSNYEKALALQQFLRFGDFVYSEDAPVDEGYDGSGLDVIAKFLEVKSGYCVHFASAMALMARTLGIPSRVAVGFLPGDSTNERSIGRVIYEATSHDLHTWPELYFEGVGWLPFEPTAGRGSVPDYADASMEGVPVPPIATNPTPKPTDAGAERPVDLDNGASGGSTSAGSISSSVLWLAAILLGFLLLVSAPALVRWSERRSSFSVIGRGFAPATVAWREILHSAEDAGTRVPSTATPREAGRLLANVMAEGSNDALARVVRAIELEGFAKPGSGGSALVGDVREVVARLLRFGGRGRRLRAILLPASLWRRALSAVRQVDAG